MQITPPLDSKKIIQPDILCFCSGTTTTRVKELIDNGMETIADIAQQTGASTGCGSCDVLILELLQKKQAYNPFPLSIE